MLKNLILILSLFSLNFYSYSQGMDTTLYRDANKIIERGFEYFDNNEFNQSKIAFKSIHPGDTNYIRAVSGLVYNYVYQEEYDSAIHLALKTLEKPNRLTAYLLTQLGIAYNYKGEIEKALKTFENGIQKYPYYQPLLFNYGVALMNNKQLEEAMNVFIRNLELDPFHADTHLQLGNIAIFQGHRAKAMMSLLTSLAINPSNTEVVIQIQTLLNDSDESEASIAEFTNNPYVYIDKLIRAKVALNDKFKSDVKINAVLVKQTELLIRSLKSSTEDDFWTRFYTPIFLSIEKNKQTPDFIYKTLSGLDKDEVQEWLEKNEDEVSHMIDNFSSKLEIFRNSHETKIARIEDTYSFWYFDSGDLSAIGNQTADNTNFGPYEYYHSNGQKSAEGQFNNSGDKVGYWVYYHANGAVSQQETFDDEGLLQGAAYYYYDNGILSRTDNYVDNKLEGKTATYYLCGTIKESNNYSQGEYDGYGFGYYNTGEVYYSFKTSNGQIDGPFQYFYKNGQLRDSSTYLVGVLSGEYKSYYDNGSLRQTGEYKDGQLQGTWTEYYENGKVKYLGNYVDGLKFGDSKNFYENGVLDDTQQFNNLGLASGTYTKYDEDGKKSLEYQYNHGRLLGYKFYNQAGQITNSQFDNLGNFDYTDYYSNGALQYKIKYVAGKPDGLFTHYHINGKKHYTIRIVQGEWNGEFIEYFSSGELKIKTYFVNGTMNGYYQEFHPNGKLALEGNYVQGNGQQEWISYFKDEVISDKYFYINGELNGPHFRYSPNGQLFSLEIYDAGLKIEMNQFDSLGNNIYTLEMPNGSQEVKIPMVGGAIRHRTALTCGDISQDLIDFFPNGTIETLRRINYSELNGKIESFFPSGQPSLIGYFKNNLSDSTWIYYNEEGNATSKINYLKGVAQKVVGYYSNGQIENDYQNINKSKSKLGKYFSSDGLLQIQKTYNPDIGLIGYQYTNQHGQLTDIIEVPANGDFKIEAYFQNGKTSTIQHYKDGLLDGESIYFNIKGVLIESISFKYGLKHGWERIYYDNGKLKSETPYYFNGENGVEKEYYATGNLKKLTTWRSGLKNGVEIWYSPEGKENEKLHYWNDVAY